ncbi:MAG: molybdopterin-dependent oxidoreductase [Phycisphaerales bacterium]|nr:molybdopterin-dependent oxidoreductase [Phycisphaerales bacterium]
MTQKPSKTITVTPLENFPPPKQWDNWVEHDPVAWPKKVERRYMLVPTTCFNCEAACGLVAYIDKNTKQIKKLEGNPHHPGSRGRNCAKGPATLNQIENPDRILYPLKRVGPRGSGQFERTSWDEALDSMAAKIRAALLEDRRNEIMYHVGRPGADGYMDRVLKSWGIDGHNSHTNVCSSSARVGYALWSGADRPSPDHANAKFILLLSAHLETGHYFNPHAQRIIEGMRDGAKLCVVDVRLSNTASKADHWLAPWPGTETTLLLAMVTVLLQEELYDRSFVENWVNWRETLEALSPDGEVCFDRFIEVLKAYYQKYTPEHAAEECGVDAEVVRSVAREIGAAGSAFASHVWRNAASGNLGGWQVSRCLQFIAVLVGAVGAEGGSHLNSDNKFVPAPFLTPPPQKIWNELLYPLEFPLAYHELSYLLPHFLEEGRGKIAAYFTRVYNPVWTNPDGLMWERMLKDESKVELHAALTPVWSETAQYADYVLPMGLGAERHDLMSQETHAAKWISFRQPVQRVFGERMGERYDTTYEANPGEVWEEDEFWIELSWRIDPDGTLGIRKYYESPTQPGQKITLDEYYGWIFENSVPGLPEAAKEHGMTPLEYMRHHGAFLVEDHVYRTHMTELSEAEKEGTALAVDGTVEREGQPVGIHVDGAPRRGFKTPSKRLELYSDTLVQWGWPEHSMPGVIESHIHHRHLNKDAGEFALISTFRLPTLIHTRSDNAKWLYELSNANPVWIHPTDAERLGIELGALVRVSSQIGHYVNRAWVTEAMRPGVIACSHHLGRWRLFDSATTDRWNSAPVMREDMASGAVRFRRLEAIGPYKSADSDTRKIWWTDGGVHQNMIFPVQPDPISGMHCWHQRVTLAIAEPDDCYGDVVVDLNRSMEIYRKWMAHTRPAPGPGGLRRPLWFARAVKPAAETYECP